MTVKYEFLVDGTRFAAVEYNTRFEPVFSWVNSLTPESLSLGAFRQEHLPCLVGPAGVGEGILTADWEGNSPTLLSNGYTAVNNVDHGAGRSGCTRIISTHGFDWDSGATEYDIILRCSWDADDPTMASPVALSQDVDLRGRVGAMFLMGNFTVKRWMLTDSSGGESEPEVAHLNEDALAVSAAFTVSYIPRNADGTATAGSQTAVLQKSQRSLSPRLTIGWADYVGSLEEVVSHLNVPIVAERDLFISSAFNTVGNAYFGKVYLGSPSSPVIDIETDLPRLWGRLNDSVGQYLYLTIEAPHNDGEYLAGPGEAPVALDAAGLFCGTPIDKRATLDQHAAGVKNVLVMQEDFVGTAHTPNWPGLNDTDADPEDFRWTIWQGSSGAGVPLPGFPMEGEQDIHTDQDLVLRTVLLPEDLPLVGGATYAEVTGVSIVATQDGDMAVRGRYAVHTTSANLSVLPLHAKLVT